jgi:hypothetical protein
MARRRDIDSLLRDWEYRVDEVIARVVKASDGRSVLQMRIDLGILQLETDNRPDGTRPHNEKTYYDYLLRESLDKKDDDEEFVMSPEQCMMADQEFAQFYHRRICWMALREFRNAVRDADHTLAFMDFVKDHSPNEEWTIGHEQYRPFVMFHRIHASCLAELNDNGPEAAITELNRGLNQFRVLYQEYDAEDKYSEDEFVSRLNDMKDSMKKHFKIGRSMEEMLAEAVKNEDYEAAAKIRDEMLRKKKPS